MKINLRFKNPKSKRTIHKKWILKIASRTVDFPVTNVGNTKVLQGGKSSNSTLDAKY